MFSQSNCTIVKAIKPVLLLVAFSLLMVHCMPAKTTAERSTQTLRIKKLLKSRMYQFIPQSVQTQTGRSFPVNSFSLVLDKDSMISYLPYFGTAYSAPFGASKGPLDFTTTGFSYSIEAGKKGQTFVNIQLKNGAYDAQEFYFNVNPDGYATLNVRFNNRQSISFYGQIGKIPEKRK